MRFITTLCLAAAALTACGQKATTANQAPVASETEVAEAAPVEDTAAVEDYSLDAAASAAIGNARIFVDTAGVAINGYDPVSFFQGAPSAGEPTFTSVRNGATYRFASAENKAAFDADPAAYEPQFGGYCAYGAAKGAKLATIPETGTIVDGKLYFNKDKSVQKLWNKDQASLIVEANATWPTIIDIDPAR